MSDERSWDDTARTMAPDPAEPIGTTRSGRGVVKWFKAAKGYGAISCDETAPFDIWCHFSVIESTQEFRTLNPGEPVEVEYYRADRYSYRYVAGRVRSLTASDSDGGQEP
jgi:CspA family cold shock protein